jgi:phosphomannomutase / phosphoglucomutase
MTKKSSRDRNKASGKKPNNMLLSAISNSIGFSILVTAGCFVYLGLFTLPAINTIAITSQAQGFADSQVSLIDQAMSEQRRRLFRIAQSGELLTALQSDDEDTLNRYRMELARAFPEAASVKIITLGPLGIASLNKGRNELRNNIELDLIRRVSNGENIEPEAYKHQNQWLFSIAGPVKSAEKKHADGALLVTLSEKYLRTLLSQLDNSLGDTKLFQLFNGKSHLITSTGSTKASEFTANADASVSNWQLSFTPSQELISRGSQNAMLVWILLGASVLTLLATGTYAYKTLTKTLAKELVALTGDSNKLYRFSLPGFESKAGQIKQLLTDKKVKAAAATPKTKAETPETKNEPATPPPKTEKPKQPSQSAQITLPADIPETIFRAYDIRGLADQQLTNDNVFAIGLAIGSEALDQGQQSIVVSADGRHSSPQIRGALVKGLLASGRDVIDIGTMPTPLMYFATHQLGTQSGVMITGSHNPAEYNGIKIVIGGKALAGTAVQGLRERIINKQISTGQGEYRTQDVEEPYIDYILNDVAIAQPLKVVIDAGNGVAGNIAPRLFEELGCEIIPLYCEVDGDFPNHHPDPSDEANLQDLIRTVKEQEADLGIAFDGDGDRMAAVSATGVVIAADRLLMLLAQDVVSRNPGADVIFDVKCTRNLNTLISNYGGRPIMWKSGHSFMKEKMAETGALLGGEFSGHIFFKERWFGFDDGMYAAARLIEILSTTDPDLDSQISKFPESISTPELKATTTDEQKFAIIEQLTNNNDFGDGKMSTLDGVRVDFPDGWGLVRASNTTPTLVLRFEADTAEALVRIQDLFKTQLNKIDNNLDLSF